MPFLIFIQIVKLYEIIFYQQIKENNNKCELFSFKLLLVKLFNCFITTVISGQLTEVTRQETVRRKKKRVDRKCCHDKQHWFPVRTCRSFREARDFMTVNCLRFRCRHG